MAQVRLYILSVSILHYQYNIFSKLPGTDDTRAQSSIARMTFIMNSVYEFTKGNFHPQR